MCVCRLSLGLISIVAWNCVIILAAAKATSDLSSNLSVLEVHSSLPALAIYLAGWIAKSSSVVLDTKAVNGWILMGFHTQKAEG